MGEETHDCYGVSVETSVAAVSSKQPYHAKRRSPLQMVFSSRWKISDAVFHRMEKLFDLRTDMRKVEIGWRTENEEGHKMEMVAIRESSKYSYKYCLKGEDEWTFVDKVSLEHLQELREILNMRYRRRRGSYKEVEFVDKMIKALG